MIHNHKLNSSSEFLELLFENSAHGVIAFDNEYNITFRNSRNGEIHPYPQDEDIHSWSQYIEVFELDGVTPTPHDQLPIVRAFRGETVKESYHILKRKLASTIIVRYEARPIKNNSGEQIGVLLTSDECTDLEKSHARFQAIFEQSPLSVQIIDKSGKTVLVNKAFGELWGFSEEFIKNFILKDYNMLEDKMLEEAGELQNIRRAFSGEIVELKEFLYDPERNNLPGRARYTKGLFYPLKNARGDVREIVLIHQDVTDKVKMEKEKHRDLEIQNFMTQVKSHLASTIEFEKVIEKIADSSLPFLADGCMFDIVEAGEIKRVITKHRDPNTQIFLDELQREYPPRIDSPQPTARCIRTGQPEFLRMVNSDTIKERTYETRHLELIQKIDIQSHIAVPLIIRGKVMGALNLFVSSGRPLFDERDFAAAQELARHASVAFDNAQLYKNAKKAIQLRDDFISIASHELKTPITSLNLQLEVLNTLIDELPQNVSGAKLIHKFFGNTKNQLTRLTRLIDDMLDISRISHGKMYLNLKNVYLNGLIQDLLERFRDQLQSQKIETKFFANEDILCICDPERIDQVITNLMTNAIRYGGKSPIHIYLEQCPEFVTIKVKDHGRGISREDQQRIFMQFERAHTEEDVNGLGLGLYINKQIVEEHQGKILLESEVGKGSNFIVKLPKVRS